MSAPISSIHERLAKGGAVCPPLERGSPERIGWRPGFERAQGVGPGAVAVGAADLAAARSAGRAARSARAFGGRLRLAVAGGAPMPFETVARFFLAMGVEALQGYGMTKSSPVVSVNRLGRNDPEASGETLARRLGQARRQRRALGQGPERDERLLAAAGGTSAKALDPDGWLRTGDQARIEGGRLCHRGPHQGHHRHLDRRKGVARSTSSRRSAADPLFEQAMIVGEQRPFIAAFAVVNRGGAGGGGEGGRTFRRAGRADRRAGGARELALHRIRRAVADLPDYATRRRVFLTLEPWTVSAGLMTPTLKLKRLAIETAFAAEIAAMYAKG